jgi:hypothetical protein
MGNYTYEEVKEFQKESNITIIIITMNLRVLKFKSICEIS